MTTTPPFPIHIRSLLATDAEALAELFAPWHKPLSQFEQYYLEQLLDKRLVLVALSPAAGPMGYVTILWESPYTHFWRRGIPEIVDLNVMTAYQRRGVGSALIARCEAQARQRGYRRLGISVVQADPDYAAARRLYPALGYVPDGFGLTPEDHELHLFKTLLPEP
ncbi:MAG: GNAT family N-acetyltransferase [Anaerolineae bacterium]|nr:GNAT family N-acetyltransferase [Anaerolineae bacterium]